tara:strand:+ start:534 stop:1313 length:780 start_codon:yes stop_codon:yes gene_type:complete
MKNINFFLLLFLFTIISLSVKASEQSRELLNPGWSFKGYFGKFDRASLQRGYQVYTEVCASCHSMKYLHYRNLAQPGGPEFSEEQAKIIASQFEVEDGPNNDGDMFQRPARLSDNFVSPYPNDESAKAANGGAYPPDMSVLVKARKGGANYIYSLLLGYDDPPASITLDDGVYYNTFMSGNKIKMAKPLSENMVQYSDGTPSTEEQMAKDVVTFLAWAAEPHLEARHKMGFKVILYLLIISILVFYSMKKIWSRVETEV